MTDLRLHDHEPLSLAHNNNEEVLHFFCYDTRFTNNPTEF